MSTVPPEVVDQMYAQASQLLDNLVAREAAKDHGIGGLAQHAADIALMWTWMPHDMVASLLSVAIMRLAHPAPDLPPLLTTEETPQP